MIGIRGGSTLERLSERVLLDGSDLHTAQFEEQERAGVFLEATSSLSSSLLEAIDGLDGRRGSFEG